MTVYQLPSSAADNYVFSADTTSYTAARAGTGNTKTIGSVSAAFFTAGQEGTTGNQPSVYEAFTSHTTSGIATTDVPVSAEFRFTTGTTFASWLLVMREKDWGTSVDTADFVPGASLGTLPFLAQAQISSSLTSNTILAAGSAELLDRLKTPGPIRALWHSDRTRLNQAPNGPENANILSGDSATPAALRVCTVPSSALLYVAAASVQLSDGSHMRLQVSGDPTPIVSLVWTTVNGSTNTIDAVPTGTGSAQFALQPGLQSLALARDTADNLYVLGPRGSAPGTEILAKAWVKGAGAWSARTALAASVPAYPKGNINNVVAAWHGTSGSGHLMVLLSHHAGAGKTGQVAYATLSAAALLAGAGSALVETAADPTWLGISAASGPVPYTNETGSNLDVATPVAGAVFGVGYTCDAGDRGINGRYTLTADGHVDTTLSGPMAGDAVISHDADSKTRAVPIGIDRVAFVGADGHVAVRTYSGTLLGSVDLPTQGLVSFPAAAALRGTAAWDAVYDAASNKLWVYYRDASSASTVRRTGVSMATYQASGEEINVSAAASGMVAVGVRAPRMLVDERSVSVDIAYADGSLITVTDSFNVAPAPPSLIPQVTFDATVDQPFAWMFADPNSRDTQSAYQVQIFNATSGASAYDSGKVTSTASQHTLPGGSIGNNDSWQWQVRTWDAADVPGVFSARGSFSTTSAGAVSITDPATDNPAGLNTASVTVTWTVTGATQAQYRVRTVNTATGATLSDTGFVVSTATSATVTGLATDTEYRIEVTIKDTNGVLSSTGTRLVTPSYSRPEAPVITATDSGAGYILISITNPPPQGDEPDVSHNDVSRREAGTTTWTRIASIPPNAEYRDYAAASGQSYEYKVTAVV